MTLFPRQGPRSRREAIDTSYLLGARTGVGSPPFVIAELLSLQSKRLPTNCVLWTRDRVSVSDREF